MTHGLVDDASPVDCTPVAVAEWSQHLQHKLFALEAHLDDSWRVLVGKRWPALAQVPDGRLQGRLLGTLLLRRCRAVPSALRLAAPEIRLCLLERTNALRSLAVLALVRRPGALRCCIDRGAKAALHDALGPLLGPLEGLSGSGRPVDADAAGWSPLHWACLGYVDWLKLLQPEDELFKRLVRLSLPARLLDMRVRRRAAPPELPPRQALQVLKDAEAHWPC
ncbi:MAG TPA: type III secretion protein HrpB4 [Albitalea sp.]|uniref:type III secretion protein HrpB4 n=1 Tax=Piscinibacter sp. TaxID=1903157 RepID=UPI002ED30093